MWSRLRQILTGADHVLVATHVSPDPDAIGSLLALGYLLRGLETPRTLLSEDGIPYDAEFLPGVDEVVAEPPASFDVAVLLDCPGLERIGKAAQRLPGATIVNIDHHPTNAYFGDLNLVDTAMPSTCQIVYRLAGALGLDITPELATCLLAGLVGDTQGFRIPATDQRALLTAAALMEAGADLWQVNRAVFSNRPLGHLVLWGQALSGVVIEDGLVWASIPLAATRAAGLPEGEDAGLVNFLLATQGTRAAAVLNERSDGTVDVSLRSLPGVDVAAVAAAFEGGGHRQAAGCTVPGTLTDVADRILARLRQAVDEASLRSAVS